MTNNNNSAAGATAPPPWAMNHLPIAEPAARRAAVLDTVRQQVGAHQDAFYVVDLAELAHKYKEWCTQLPRARPFYAVKCNDDPHIVSTLASLGAGFDCASKGEMSMALSLGVKPEDIIFAHPAKQPSHLTYARNKGVLKMTFDNEDELVKIAEYHPGAELVLRILADDSHSVCRLGLKFGAPLDRVESLLSRAKELKLNVIGISYHVGSGNGNAESFADAVRDARRAFDVAAGLGMKLSLLDVGGGFPGSELGVDLDAAEHTRDQAKALAAAGGRHDPYAEHPSFRAIAGHVRAALDAHFPPGSGVTIIGEPGRFFVKSTHTLAVSVVGKRATEDEGPTDAKGRPLAPRSSPSSPPGGAPSGGTRYNYYVNDGLYGSFNCIVYDHATAAPQLLLRVDKATGQLAHEMDLVSLAQLAQRQGAGAGDDAVAKLGADGTPVAADAVGLAAAVQLAQTAALEQSQRVAAEQEQEEALALKQQLRMGGAGAVGGSTASTYRDSLAAVFGAAAAAGAGSAGASRVAHARGASSSSGSGLAPLPRASLLALHPTTLWGPTCDSFDKISDDVPLPELQQGDWLVYENMGAYTIAGSCKFNGFPLSTKVYLHTDGRVEVQKEEEHA